MGCFGTEALRDVLVQRLNGMFSYRGFTVQRLNGMFWYRGLMGCFWYRGLTGCFDVLNADPEYTRGQKMSPCRGPRVYSGAECVFFVFLSVKSMWSDNHEGSLVFADKSLFLF